MKHPIEPPHAKSLKELGIQLGQLRYDALIVVFLHVRKEILRQARGDRLKHRPLLARSGEYLADHLSHSIDMLTALLRISLKPMKEDIKKRPLLIKVRHHS